MTARGPVCSGMAAVLAVGLTVPPAAADAPRVLLVRPAEAEPPVSAALMRVRGELVADGFEVALVEAKPGTTSAAAMTAAEHDPGSATVGLFLSPDGKGAELWVVDRLTGKSVVRRVDTVQESSDQLSRILAVRAVELLRASLLELMVEQREVEQKSQPRPSPETARRASEWAGRPIGVVRRPRWALELGPGVVLTHPTRVGAAVVAVGRARIALTRRIAARASFGGLGTRPEIAAPEGIARVQQSWALGELVLAPWPEWPVIPVVSLGAGVTHLAVEGEAAWPYRGVKSARWFFGTDVGVGAAFRIAPRLDLVAEAHALVALREPAIRFVGREVARVAEPALIGSLTVAGWL